MTITSLDEPVGEDMFQEVEATPRTGPHGRTAKSNPFSTGIAKAIQLYSEGKLDRALVTPPLDKDKVKTAVNFIRNGLNAAGYGSRILVRDDSRVEFYARELIKRSRKNKTEAVPE